MDPLFSQSHPAACGRRRPRSNRLLVCSSQGVAHDPPLATFQWTVWQNWLCIFCSTNLLDWTYLSKIGGFFECPDIFELPVDDNPSEKRWVLMDAGFNYMVGKFDGTQFIPETGKMRADYGASQYVYAPQTWKKAGNGVGSPIQIGFMRYPSPSKMPGSPHMV